MENVILSIDHMIIEELMFLELEVHCNVREQGNTFLTVLHMNLTSNSIGTGSQLVPGSRNKGSHHGTVFCRPAGWETYKSNSTNPGTFGIVFFLFTWRMSSPTFTLPFSSVAAAASAAQCLLASG